LAAVDDRMAQDIEDSAHGLGMDVLLEVHDRNELERALRLRSRLIGVNNRDLKTFKTSVATSKRLAPLLPPDRICVSESGIFSNADLRSLSASGTSAFLVGESLMRASDVAAATRTLLGGVQARAAE
jgi:indole-3-glycerol phosphate synthase